MENAPTVERRATGMLIVGIKRKKKKLTRKNFLEVNLSAEKSPRFATRMILNNG